MMRSPLAASRSANACPFPPSSSRPTRASKWRPRRLRAITRPTARRPTSSSRARSAATSASSDPHPNVSSTTLSQSPVEVLLSAAAVRERAHEMLALALDGTVEGWYVELDRLDDAVALTAAVTRERFPDFRIPFHARNRHFVASAPKLPDAGDAAARARAAFDLVIVSVLLDAGAGAQWQYRDAGSGLTLARSEGLAVASQRLFEAGAFSSDITDPLRADGRAL